MIFRSSRGRAIPTFFDYPQEKEDSRGVFNIIIVRIKRRFLRSFSRVV